MFTIKQQKILKNILILFILFYFSKSKFIDITLNPGLNTRYIQLTSEILKLKIKEIKNYSYLRIIAEGNGQTKETNHIISYYKEKYLKERKQLSQSLNDKTIMWLNKEQITENFYITIECAKKPCSFTLLLEGKNSVELFLNEQYTFYVSEEKKK